ncbi:two-component response regulator [Bordetella pertussis]|nr:two-component response regulator [Bordetella pertussis]
MPLPADERELACVLLALARRLPAWQEDEEAVAQRGTDDEGWELRDQDWTLVAPGGEELSLSANERQIVRLLLGAAGRAELASELAVDGPAVRSTGERSIDVIVSRLRRKAELAGLVLPIRTVYGSGYLFANS